MNTLSIDELKSLVEARPGPFVTISLPTRRAGADTRQNPIRFKKLLRDAEERLALTVRAPEAQHILEPARKLLEDTPFWQHQSDGLAVFISPKLFRYYHLPLKPEELVVVGDRFHIKPILRLLTGDCRFHILALSQNQVRLLEGTPYSAHEMELKGIPGSLAEALKYDQPEKQVQFRTMPRSSGRAGRGGTIFYGQGAGVEIAKDRILRYFHQVDDGLCKQIKDQRVPLVFAGVEYLFPIYKEVNTYPTLVSEAIVGNPEEWGPDELHKRAWAIVQPFFQQKEREAAAYYRQVVGTARASHNLSQVAPAAYQGRVEVLFVPLGVQRWGTFAPEVNAIHEYDDPQPGSEDMLDFAASHTLLHGGTVYAVDPQYMPNGSSIAAVFRY
jgi:Bacterial archaeo-eukaryotic release factor family 7